LKVFHLFFLIRIQPRFVQWFCGHNMELSSKGLYWP
jgi:hypothetical protein